MRSTHLTRRARTDRFTLLAFLATVVMLFAAFTAAYLIRRTASDWKPVNLPGVLWLNTGVIIFSSLVLELARRSRRRALAMAATALGFLFLAGQLFAWWTLSREGVFLPSSPHASFFYLTTAIHGLHLAGGIGALIWFSLRGTALTLCALYWHFLCGVWIYLLALLTFL